MMDERTLQSIKMHLQSEDAQKRIRQNIQRGRAEATVTISHAARLYNFTENQLRDWEKRGLLKPPRSKDTSGQRQYSPTELDRLAIIRELMDEGYTLSEIPPYDDELWNSEGIPDDQPSQAFKVDGEAVHYLAINQRIENVRAGLFWRYFVSRVLRLSLMLICEDIPNTTAGLVLPLRRDIDTTSTYRIEDLPKVGESIVGWLSRGHSFHTLFTSTPSFEYSTDYRLLRLQVMKEDEPEDVSFKDNTLIIIDRRSKLLTLSLPIVETIRRLLAPIYEEGQNLVAYFGSGMRDALDPVLNFNNSTVLTDVILNGFANMVVRLGGQTVDGQQRWRFCCILLPQDSTLPLQQGSLVVRGKSRSAPHKIGLTIISPNDPIVGLSLRAFQSGRIIYRPKISAEAFSIALLELEGPIHSAIAAPIGAEDGQPMAVLYIVSDESDAFTKGDQSLLRMMGRIIEELLKTYRIHLQVREKLMDLITNPGIVDMSFRDFLSENEFIGDVENLLVGLKKSMESKTEQLAEEVVSFIAVDIDNQSSLANKYGDQMVRNLSREVGLRILRQLSALFRKYPDSRLYHIYADRYYLMFKSMPLDQAREKAEQLMQALKGSYQIDALRASNEQPVLPDSMLVVSDVTVRLGVTSYKYTMLKDILQRYSSIAEVRSIFTDALDVALKMGKDEGGDVVIAWDPGRGFVRWSLSKDK